MLIFYILTYDSKSIEYVQTEPQRFPGFDDRWRRRVEPQQLQLVLKL